MFTPTGNNNNNTSPQSVARTQGRAGAVTAMGSGAPGSASEVYEGVQGPGMQGSTSDYYDADQIDPADGAPEYVQTLGTPLLCNGESFSIVCLAPFYCANIVDGVGG